MTKQQIQRLQRTDATLEMYAGACFSSFLNPQDRQAIMFAVHLDELLALRDKRTIGSLRKCLNMIDDEETERKSVSVMTAAVNQFLADNGFNPDGSEIEADTDDEESDDDSGEVTADDIESEEETAVETFKKGERVQVVRSDDPDYADVIGKYGVVRNVKDDGIVNVKIDGEKSHSEFYAHELTHSDATAPDQQFGVEKTADLPFDDTKAALFIALKRLGAVGSYANAQPTKAIANMLVKVAGEFNLELKSGKSPMWCVRHYGYHAKAGMLVEVSQMPGEKAYYFNLTKAGMKVDPLAELAKVKAKGKGSKRHHS